MATEPQSIKIGDRSRWAFFNGAWEDGPDGALQVPQDILSQDGPGMQGHHYAFAKDTAYADFRARFEIQLSPHSNVGLIFRAADASHFYVLHFPNCGQASRAQHFWAGLSKMDATGYFKIIKLDLIQRVASNSDLWLDCEVAVVGEKITARIGRHGHFEATDATFRGPGRIGIFQFSRATMRNLVIEANAVDAAPWDQTITPRGNLLTPFGASQGLHGLVRTSSGELLFYHSLSDDGNKSKAKYFSSRSADNGRTWGEPEQIEEAIDLGFNPEFGFCPTNIGSLHRSPGGPLLKVYAGKSPGEHYICESKDDGHTWLEPFRWERPDGRSGWMMGDPILDLQDGSMLVFSCGGYEPLKCAIDAWSWGSGHCQAFAYRSTDGGKTWSDPVNIDGTAAGPQARSHLETTLEGNMDLTETSAIQMPDGRIMALIRPCYSPALSAPAANASAVTREPCVRGPFPGYNTTPPLRTASGAILVAHRLPELTIHVSRDDGHTWDAGTTIDSGIGAGGRMLEVEPNVLLYAYFPSHGAVRAQFIRVTPSGLEPAQK